MSNFIVFLNIILIILPFVYGQNLFEVYKDMMLDQARRNKPLIDIEVFGESLCPDTTSFLRKQLWPAWTSLQGSNLINVTYHPFGLARCKRNEKTGIQCECQHGPSECRLNMLQACVISALQFPQLYLPIVYCMQGKRDFSAAIDECITNFVPRPDLDEVFMVRCSESQLGAKLMIEHGYRQYYVAPEIDWVPWVLINGRRSKEASRDLKDIICSYPQFSSYQYCE